ncbi:thioredoxin [Pseudomonas azotoformans]|uniref:Thioredoxin n=1 Tax=Pseudomonas azotoformans TaxID=47878 RepID=A0A1V2JHP8_PSEAZ|nr:thioredoxin family protein [Pseudomonas azotoformans]OIN51720.1 thioredoxin [Pseudomonas azotoformans]ONH44396.1 thioredoxin [Pseudomonas azotoformans]SDN30765.1 thioredoxin 1 [Pseudomonas azotoformans]
MNYVNAVIADKAAFERELETTQPVFVVFISHHCAACRDAMPPFMRISERYKNHVKILILDCAETPRHPSVDRIPMLLIYHNHVLLETLPGLGEQALERAFEQYSRLPAVTSGVKASG